MSELVFCFDKLNINMQEYDWKKKEFYYKIFLLSGQI